MGLRRPASLVLQLAVGLVALSGCRLDYSPASELDFTCERDDQCLDDFACVDGHCVAGVPSVDAGVRDGAGTTDSATLDATQTDLSRYDTRAMDGAAADGAALDSAASDLSSVDGTSPDGMGPDGAAPDAAGPDAATRDSARPDALLPDTLLPDTLLPDTLLPDTLLPDTLLPDTLLPDVYSAVELCDGYDNDWNDAVDEGCDDDGDGYCDDQMTVVGSPAVCPNSAPDTGDDCDDTMPTCHTDCTNSDGDSESDCVEAFCGSDPGDATSVCDVVPNRTQLNNAIAFANQNQDEGPFFIFLEDMQINDALTEISTDEGVTIRQRPGAELRLNAGGDKDVLKISGNNVTLDGIHFRMVNNVKQWLEITGASDTIRHCIFEGFEQRGIKLTGTALYTVLQGNILVGGGASADNNDRAAILLDQADETTIVGNVLVGNNTGISLHRVEMVRIDHNTLADNRVRGINVYGGADSTDVCMRNNVFSGNARAIAFERPVVWDETSACVTALEDVGSGPRYGNAASGNTLLCDEGACAGATTEADCVDCLPALRDLFWEFLAVPEYATTTLGHIGFYCPQNGDLIDKGDPLDPGNPIYDRNGAQPDEHNGTAPDIGGRETGTPECGG